MVPRSECEGALVEATAGSLFGSGYHQRNINLVRRHSQRIAAGRPAGPHQRCLDRRTLPPAQSSPSFTRQAFRLHSRAAADHLVIGIRETSMICKFFEAKFVTSKVRPSAVRRISRGNAPAGIVPNTVRLAASITESVEWSLAPPAKRLEFATTIFLPSSTTATPTGELPTGTLPISACSGSPSNFAVSNASIALALRAVTYARSPPGESAKRTALHPAGIFAITAWAGSVRARATSITSRAPSGKCSCDLAPSATQTLGHPQSPAASLVV